MKLQIDNLGKVAVTIEAGYWDIKKPYDKLTIIERAGTGTTFISRKPVPAGTSILNRNYWIKFSKWSDIPYEITQKFGDSDELAISQKTLTNKFSEVENEIQEGDEALDQRLRIVEVHERIMIDGGELEVATAEDLENPQTPRQEAAVPTVRAIIDASDDEPHLNSTKRFINSNNLAKMYGYYLDNPEFIYILTDDEYRIILGVKTDGDVIFGVTVPSQIKEYIDSRINEILGVDDVTEKIDTINEMIAFFEGIRNDKTLQQLLAASAQAVTEEKTRAEAVEQHLDEVKANKEEVNAALDTKVDKEEGKSLIDAEYASTKSTVDNPEFLNVTTDSEDKVLEGIQPDGTKVFGGDIRVLGNMEVSGVSYKIIENPEYLAAWLDAEDKVVFGLKADGKTYVGDADFLNEIKNNKEAISELKAVLSSISSSIESLDINALSSITAVENPEYLKVELDAEDRVLSGTKADGSHYAYNMQSETINAKVDKEDSKSLINKEVAESLSTIEDPERRSEIVTDSDGRIISYRDSEGVMHENVGINTPFVNIPKDIRFDIISLYPEEKMIPILKNLTFVRHEADGHWDDFDGHRINHQPYFPLILLHFTDIHEDSYNLSRIYKFYQKYKEYIDDVVFTGDVVLDVFDPSKSLPYWKNGNADEFLFVVGNHDACSNLSPFTPVSPREEYNTYIEPFLSKTNINSVDGKCYWYKDYPNAKSPECPNGIRLIAVDQYHWYEREVIGEYVNPIYSDGTAVDTGQQEAWLNNLLGSARENGLAVIMALHSPVNGEDTIDIDCTFNTLTEKGAQAAYSNIPVTMLNDIQNFINAGGEFICWMAGHMHQDWFVRIKDFPDQIIMLANTGSSEMRDRSAYLLKDTMYADNFNIFSIDPFKKFIRLHRIGLNFDVHGRHIENLVYDYKNKVIVCNN